MQYVLFGKEIRPGVLQSSVQQTCPLQKYQRHKRAGNILHSILSLLSGLLARQCLLNDKLNHSRSNLAFKNVIIYLQNVPSEAKIFNNLFDHDW